MRTCALSKPKPRVGITKFRVSRVALKPGPYPEPHPCRAHIGTLAFGQVQLRLLKASCTGCLVGLALVDEIDLRRNATLRNERIQIRGDHEFALDLGKRSIVSYHITCYHQATTKPTTMLAARLLQTLHCVCPLLRPSQKSSQDRQLSNAPPGVFGPVLRGLSRGYCCLSISLQKF